MSQQKVTIEEEMLLATNHRYFIRQTVLTGAKITISSFIVIGVVYLMIFIGSLSMASSSGSNVAGLIFAVIASVVALLAWIALIIYWLHNLFQLDKKVVLAEKELNAYEVIEG